MIFFFSIWTRKKLKLSVYSKKTPEESFYDCTMWVWVELLLERRKIIWVRKDDGILSFFKLQLIQGASKFSLTCFKLQPTFTTPCRISFAKWKSFPNDFIIPITHNVPTCLKIIYNYKECMAFFFFSFLKKKGKKTPSK